jgi:hypothetical protein
MHELYKVLNFGFTHGVLCDYLKLPLCFCLVSAALLKESTVFLTASIIFIQCLNLNLMISF